MSEGMKISETLEFLTQIHTSRENLEQRAALRARSRRTISYDYIGIETWQSQYLRSLVYSQQTQLFQIPLWHAADRIMHPLYESEANIKLKPENIWQWRGCGGALLWANDTYGGTYYPVVEYTSTGIVGLGKQLAADIPRGKNVICPVAWGVLSQSDKYSNYTSNITAINITVEIMREAQAPLLPNALNETHYEPEKNFWGMNFGNTYKGYPLFMKPPAWNNDITANFSRNANRLDNHTGSFFYDLKSNNPTETKQHEYVMSTRSEINNMQRFFTNCKGRAHSFYAPTWLNDIELVDNVSAGSNYMLAKYPYYWKYFSKTNRRKLAIVIFKDKTAQILPISGYSTDETGEYSKIYLESPLAAAINSNNVAMISFLCQYRFDSDTMVTDFESVDVATTTFALMEVTQ